jgi:leucine dehydrogenase
MQADPLADEFEHEQLSVFHDAETGVTGAIAVHSTVLGPAMGGLRLCKYPQVTDALLDSLRLARAMSFKNAAAGLELGGGKAVLLDDGAWNGQRAARLRAVGRAVEDLGGRYVTAEDVGTTPDDMDVISEVTRHVAGRTVDRGGRGNPSPYTARTVFGSIESATRIRLGCTGLAGIRVGVQGVGHVGAQLVELLSAAGARVFVTDIDPNRALAVANEHGATPLPLAGFVTDEFDVLAPCALGGAIGSEHVDRLRVPIIAGAANNPLADRALAATLAAGDVLYVPDFLANCGGIIHVGAEVLGLSEDEVESLLSAALERTDRLLSEAVGSGRVPIEVAEEYAQERLRAGQERVG